MDKEKFKMTADEIALLLGYALPLIEFILKQHGFIHNIAGAKLDEKEGVLIWDYIVWNEITFDDMDGNKKALFTSFSDEETERKWCELVEKYGVKK